MPITGFEAKLEDVGHQIILRMPEEASAQLPSRGQVAITGEMNHHGFQTVLEPDGRKGHWFRVDKNLQEALGVRAGDTVTLEIQPTKRWPEPEIPRDFSTALARASDIRELWQSITPMARWEWVRWINATKNPATRQRRVEVSISKLRSGKRRPCCFDLAACTDPELSRNGVLLDTVNV